ncbi:MAG: translation initiation factor eIF-2B [Candidatus Hodarchaeales archaeon]|jgi:ribose 1,5-bisphosphate isomerase
MIPLSSSGNTIDQITFLKIQNYKLKRDFEKSGVSFMNEFTSSKEYQHLSRVMEEIKALQIQGATNIARIAVEAFADYVQILSLEGAALETHLLDIVHQLSTVRVTEPALRNGLRYTMGQIRKEGTNAAKTAAHNYISMIKESTAEIAKIGAARIQDGTQIMTHCRSSITTNILREAAKQGKKFEVVCTETRPRWQGRKTARELVEAGIQTYQVVDGAMRWAMREFDIALVLIGADSITVEGTAINKIGSRLLALGAAELHLPLYVCSSLLKFDSETKIGRLTEIEMRDPAEIWEVESRPEGLKILNPAFETVSREYISGYICEFGVIPPQAVFHVFSQNLLPILDGKA